MNQRLVEHDAAVDPWRPGGTFQPVCPTGSAQPTTTFPAYRNIIAWSRGDAAMECSRRIGTMEQLMVTPIRRRLIRALPLLSLTADVPGDRRCLWYSAFSRQRASAALASVFSC
jgi:hypothetical protein